MTMVDKINIRPSFEKKLVAPQCVLKDLYEFFTDEEIGEFFKSPTIL